MRESLQGWRVVPRRVAVAASAVAMVGMSAGVARADDESQPVDFTHNVLDAPAPVTGAVFGTAPAVKAGTAICTTPDADRRQRQHRLRDDVGRPAQRDLDRGQPDRTRAT